MAPRRTTAWLTAAALFASQVIAPPPLGPGNGLGLTPQMGWNNWNSIACNVDEEVILENARKLVDLGLRDLGYNYVIMDDCWSAGRSENGTLQANMTKFPSGIKGLADQVHDMGLKWGMYSSAGKYTCAQYTGSLGYEKQDAQTFADWGVDYLKYDNCYNEGQEGNSKISYDRYRAMSDALNATGRPIFYGMCNWGTDYPWNFASTIANSWRIAGDIYDSFDRPDPRCPCTTWDCNLPGFHCSVMNILNKVAAFVDKGRPGGWNDLDALEVGNSGMSDDEYKLHMSMWALVKSPLIMGNDLTTIDAPSLSILSNPAILAISQDSLGAGAFRSWQRPGYGSENNTYSADLYTAGETYLWTGRLTGGDQVIALLNAGNEQTSMSATMEEIFVDYVTTGSNKPSPQTENTWDVYDLWANRMSDDVAQAVIDNGVASMTGSGNGTNGTATYTPFNVTTTTYADAVKNNDTVLLGQKVGTLAPGGNVQADVPSHGVAVYRLRSQTMIPAMGKKRRRDEL